MVTRRGLFGGVLAGAGAAAVAKVAPAAAEPAPASVVVLDWDDGFRAAIEACEENGWLPDGVAAELLDALDATGALDEPAVGEPDALVGRPVADATAEAVPAGRVTWTLASEWTGAAGKLFLAAGPAGRAATASTWEFAHAFGSEEAAHALGTYALLPIAAPEEPA